MKAWEVRSSVSALYSTDGSPYTLMLCWITVAPRAPARPYARGCHTAGDVAPIRTVSRVEQVWGGNNSFFCDGRLISGPNLRDVGFTLAVLLVPGVIFASFTCVCAWLLAAVDDAPRCGGLSVCCATVQDAIPRRRAGRAGFHAHIRVRARVGVRRAHGAYRASAPVRARASA